MRHRQGAGGVQGRRAAFPALRRGGVARGRDIHADRRLRPPSGEMRATVAAARGAFPGRRLLLAFQPPLAPAVRDCSRIAWRARFGRCAGAGRSLCRRRGADRRRRRRHLGARSPVPPDASIPCSSKMIADMPQTILGIARDGDVGDVDNAGSIGSGARQTGKWLKWKQWTAKHLESGRSLWRQVGRARSVAEKRFARAGRAAAAGRRCRGVRSGRTRARTNWPPSTAPSSCCTAATARTGDDPQGALELMGHPPHRQRQGWPGGRHGQVADQAARRLGRAADPWSSRCSTARAAIFPP